MECNGLGMAAFFYIRVGDRDVHLGADRSRKGAHHLSCAVQYAECIAAYAHQGAFSLGLKELAAKGFGGARFSESYATHKN
jgi:hypothetical protein